MSHAVCHQSRNLRQHQTPSRVLLVLLSGAHDQLIIEMENVGRITHGPQPDPAELTAGRWHISQASLKRRSLSARVHSFLSNRLDGADLQCVKRVQMADQDMMRLSARHVGEWPMQAICRNWQGYCEASHEIRAHMKAHILLERRFLYPMLEQLAARGI